MNELFVGAAIALASSIVTSFVVHLLETKRSVQSRKWQLEDLRNNELLELTKERIEKIEVVLDKFRDVVLKAIETETSLITMSKGISQKEMFGIFSSEDKAVISNTLLSLKNENPDEFENFSTKLEEISDQVKADWANADDLMREINKQLPYIVALDNGRLLQSVMELISLVSSEQNQFFRVSNLIASKDGFDEDEEMRRMIKFVSDATHLHGQIIKQLDIMRVKKIS